MGGSARRLRAEIIYESHVAHERVAKPPKLGGVEV